MDTRTICLGVLSLGDATGYEIKKTTAEGAFAQIYEASYGSIYPALNRLTEEGLVTCRAESQENRPDKKVYSITQKGREAFRNALLKRPADDRFRSEFLFQMLFATLMPPEHAGHLVDDRIARVRAELDALKTRSNELPDDPAVCFVRDYGIAMFDASLRYLESNRDALVDALKSDARPVKAAE